MANNFGISGDVCKELAGTLQHLLKIMQELRINFGFNNFSHDSPYKGKPEPYILSSLMLMNAEVQNGKVVIRSKDAIFRIYETKTSNPVVTLLEWARDQLAKLTKSMTTEIRTILAPDSVAFFSTSTRPPRRPVPIFG